MTKKEHAAQQPSKVAAQDDNNQMKTKTTENLGKEENSSESAKHADAERAAADKSAAEKESSSGFKVFDRRFWASDADTDDGSDQANVPSYVESLENKLKEKEQQLQDYIAAYKKEVVEGLDATKSRLEKESKQKETALKSSMAEPMIDILEAVERSLLLASDNPTAESLISGFQLVKQLIDKKLSEFGLERINSSGAVFDPEFHEAIAMIPATPQQPNNTVVAEMSPGFILEGRVIRPAKVQVAK